MIDEAELELGGVVVRVVRVGPQPNEGQVQTKPAACGGADLRWPPSRTCELGRSNDASPVGMPSAA